MRAGSDSRGSVIARATRTAPASSTSRRASPLSCLEIADEVLGTRRARGREVSQRFVNERHERRLQRKVVPAVVQVGAEDEHAAARGPLFDQRGASVGVARNHVGRWRRRNPAPRARSRRCPASRRRRTRGTRDDGCHRAQTSTARPAARATRSRRYRRARPAGSPDPRQGRPRRSSPPPPRTNCASRSRPRCVKAARATARQSRRPAPSVVGIERRERAAAQRPEAETARPFGDRQRALEVQRFRWMPGRRHREHRHGIRGIEHRVARRCRRGILRDP